MGFNCAHSLAEERKVFFSVLERREVIREDYSMGWLIIYSNLGEVFFGEPFLETLFKIPLELSSNLKA